MSKATNRKNQAKNMLDVDKSLVKDYSHLTWNDLIQNIKKTPENQEDVPIEDLLEELGLPSYSYDFITADKMHLKAYNLIKYTLDDTHCGVLYITFRNKPFCFMVNLTTASHWEAEFFQKDLIKNARNLALDLMKDDDSIYDQVKISSTDDNIDDMFKPYFNVMYYDSICKKNIAKKFYHGKKIILMSPSEEVDKAFVRLENEEEEHLVRVEEIDLQMPLEESFISMGE